MAEASRSSDAAKGGTARPRGLRPGTRVEVRNRYDGTWSAGFEIEDRTDDGYRVRRLSDGSVLPVTLPMDEVRKERRHELWWV